MPRVAKEIMEAHMYANPYEELANAIIKQSVEDYCTGVRLLLTRFRHLPTKNEFKIKGNTLSAHDAKIASNYFDAVSFLSGSKELGLLSNVDGQYLMKLGYEIAIHSEKSKNGAGL